MFRNKDSDECLITDSLQQQEAAQYSAQISQWTISLMKAGSDSRLQGGLSHITQGGDRYFGHRRLNLSLGTDPDDS